MGNTDDVSKTNDGQRCRWAALTTKGNILPMWAALMMGITDDGQHQRRSALTMVSTDDDGTALATMGSTGDGQH